MADAILNQRTSRPPPLDTVLLWLTNTVARDFAERGAFPELRHANAQALRGAALLHYLTRDRAESVLEDAMAREQSTRSSLRTAYGFHIRSMRAAMKEAEERPAAFESPAAVCTDHNESRERWHGTKDQLRAHGIRLEGPWPHEPGGKERWAQARDSRGYKTSITRHSTIWPSLYEANITIPYEVWKSKESQGTGAGKLELARRNLADMPASADAYRIHLVNSARFMVRIHLEQASKLASWHGYTIDEDSMADIQASFDVVVEAIAAARVHFDAARHAEIAQRVRAEIAEADGTFQAKFASLVRPNFRILEGGAP